MRGGGAAAAGGADAIQALGEPGVLGLGDRRRDGGVVIDVRSGDVLALTGASRLAYHGIDRLRFGSSTLLKGGGRINLTLRVVD